MLIRAFACEQRSIAWGWLDEHACNVSSIVVTGLVQDVAAWLDVLYAPWLKLRTEQNDQVRIMR